MYCILYRFEVREGMETPFVRNWETVTRMLLNAGSLGSRLHRKEGSTYIAYAQWPSREQYHQERSLDDTFREARAHMVDCCTAIETLAELEPVSDLLVHIS